MKRGTKSSRNYQKFIMRNMPEQLDTVLRLKMERIIFKGDIK